MLQIVHDVAPGAASRSLPPSGDSQSEFADHIRALRDGLEGPHAT